MEAATKELRDWVDSHPNANLKIAAVQKEFSAILDKRGIDRVVDLEGAGPGAKGQPEGPERFTPPSQ